MRSDHGRERGFGVNAAAAAGDVWYVLSRARIDDAPRTLAAAQDAVFRRYLPIARTLADGAGKARSVDPTAAELAAELGLAQAVLGWRRPDSVGFEVVAQTAIAAQLRGLPTVANPSRTRRPPGHNMPFRRSPGAVT